MPKIPISKDATIKDIVFKLRDRERYVREVLHALYEAKRDWGDTGPAEVRIGVTGEGKYPHYGVGDFLYSTQSESRLRTYHGTTHKPLTTAMGQGLNWSSRSMTLDEVKELLGSIRAATKSERSHADRT